MRIFRNAWSTAWIWTTEDYEILVLPDEAANLDYPKTRVIPTGPVGPSEKRDRAIAYANGEIMAFIDDDAYPVRELA